MQTYFMAPPLSKARDTGVERDAVMHKTVGHRRYGTVVFNLTPTQVVANFPYLPGIFTPCHIVPGRFFDMEVTDDGENLFLGRKFAVPTGDPEVFVPTEVTLHLRFRAGKWRTHSFLPYSGKLKLLDKDSLQTGNVVLKRKGRRWGSYNDFLSSGI